jgi:hypothetical protein
MPSKTAAAVKVQATMRGWNARKQGTYVALRKRRQEVDAVLSAVDKETHVFEPWVFEPTLYTKKLDGVPVPLLEYEEKLLRQQLKLDDMQSSGPAAGVMRAWRKKATATIQARLDLIDKCREKWQKSKTVQVEDPGVTSVDRGAKARGYLMNLLAAEKLEKAAQVEDPGATSVDLGEKAARVEDPGATSVDLGEKAARVEDPGATSVDYGEKARQFLTELLVKVNSNNKFDFTDKNYKQARRWMKKRCSEFVGQNVWSRFQFCTTPEQAVDIRTLCRLFNMICPGDENCFLQVCDAYLFNTTNKETEFTHTYNECLDKFTGVTENDWSFLLQTILVENRYGLIVSEHLSDDTWTVDVTRLRVHADSFKEDVETSIRSNIDEIQANERLMIMAAMQMEHRMGDRVLAHAINGLDDEEDFSEVTYDKESFGELKRVLLPVKLRIEDSEIRRTIMFFLAGISLTDFKQCLDSVLLWALTPL